MLSADPSPTRGFARRHVLVNGGRALLAVAALGAAVTACGSPPQPAPEPLAEQLDMARRDSELATAAAKATPPPVAAALLEVAAERARHASALVEEIARAAGTPIPSESNPGELTTAGSPTSTTPSAVAAPPPTPADVAKALRASAESATRLTPTLSGYRAGLLGSIAAACTASYLVGLPPGTGQP